MKLEIDIPDVERLRYIAVDSHCTIEEVIENAAKMLAAKLETYMMKKEKETK